MNRVHLLLKSDWSIVLIMTGAVKQIVEEGRILVTVHHIFSTNNGMQNLISALKTSQPNGFTALQQLQPQKFNTSNLAVQIRRMKFYRTSIRQRLLAWKSSPR